MIGSLQRSVHTNVNTEPARLTAFVMLDGVVRFLKIMLKTPVTAGRGASFQPPASPSRRPPLV